MLLDSNGKFLRTCVKDSNTAKLKPEETEHMDGAPFRPNSRAALLPVEAPPISVPDRDATPMRLEESEETRRPTHGTANKNSKEEFDAHQFTHPISVAVLSLREREGSG